ncbi:MAG: DUF2800 domain-containing protein [Myxococcales bacterium]|nr:DUF2800 domain-containing protein [Myxococcales bacterium]
MAAPLTASALPRALACPASCALPAVSSTSDEAERGTQVHAFMQAIADGTPVDEALAAVAEATRALCAKINLAHVPRGGETEVAMAWDVDARRARRLEVDGHRQYEPTATEIPGTADLVLWLDRPVVIDWKTTSHDFDARSAVPQLEHYALCVANIAWADEVECAVGVIADDGAVEWSRWRMDAAALDRAADRARRVWERVQSARAHQGEHDVTLGNHCRYCPSWRACPAHVRAVRQLAAGEVPAITAESIGAAYSVARAVEKSAEAVREGIKRFVSEHGPVKTGNQLVSLNKRGALSLRTL